MITYAEVIQNIMQKDDYQAVLDNLVSTLSSWEENYTPEMLQCNLIFFTELIQIFSNISGTQGDERREYLENLQQTIGEHIENMKKGIFHD